MLGYWAGTSLFYLFSIALFWSGVEHAGLSRDAARLLTLVGLAGMAVSYSMLRLSSRLGIAPWKLAIGQALYALTCNVALYTVTGPIRGAALMVLLVVIVFCTFSLSPRQTTALFGVTVVSLGATMLWMVARDPVTYPPAIELLHFSLAFISLAAVTALTTVMTRLRKRLSRQKHELQEALLTIRKLATVDELTALANRRHMNEVLSAEEKRVNATNGVVCIALLDIDLFKSVNDRFGHACGDQVLRSFADAARQELRSADVLARWGGEEFLLLLPDTALAEAHLVLQRMAQRFRESSIPGIDERVRITFSAGVVERRIGEPFSETISRADHAMYRAKSGGRDRILTAESA
ncbi:diguanylate cyclase [Pseudoduganella sp. GCM10020061]|uniref:diguanylate cyclase n=1 Tax=Pseudoduganella sp. GCM10020061 TaxID=3317345 RepID=UPI00362E9269